MPPILTPTEIAILEEEQVRRTSFADTLVAQVPQKTARLSDLESIDGSFKKFFTYYNDDIIGRYDEEYRAIDGRFITEPILESDIQRVGDLDASARAFPIHPATDLVRIAEFDGGGLDGTPDPDNEEEHNQDAQTFSDLLQFGVGSGTPTTATTTTILQSGDIALSTTNGFAETIQVNDKYYVSDGINFALIEVTGITDTTPPSPPPFTTDLDITLINPPGAPISTGTTFAVPSGFTDAERASKTTSDPNMQLILDLQIVDLEDSLNARISRMQAQNAALAANQDPDAVIEIATRTSDNDTAISFLQTYLVGTDVSDAGLASLDSERTARISANIARTATINANYTVQTENYYNRRFEVGNDRSNLARGTIRNIAVQEASLATTNQYAADAQASVIAIDNILP